MKFRKKLTMNYEILNRNYSHFPSIPMYLFIM